MKNLLRDKKSILLVCLGLLFSAAHTHAQDVINESDVAKLRAFIGNSIPTSSAKHQNVQSNAQIDDGVYLVQPGDTLSEILMAHVGGTGLNPAILQSVIVDVNRSAFRRGNPNWLMAGKRLKLPSREDVLSYIMPGEERKKEPNSEAWVRYP